MKAFLETSVSKTELLQSLAAHRESYSLSRDVFDYWKDGYGCAIGCSLRDFAPGSEWDEDLFQPLFGIPSGLASRMELIFHELGYTESLYWPERFVNAIRPGSDLRDVSAMFGLWRAESGYAPPSAMADRLILEIERAGRLASTTRRFAKKRVCGEAGMTNLQVITTPTFDWLAQHALACSSRMIVGSPYVNDGILELTDRVSREVSRKLVTRTNLRVFASGSSDLGTLAKDGVAVYSLWKLHAKPSQRHAQAGTIR